MLLLLYVELFDGLPFDATSFRTRKIKKACAASMQQAGFSVFC
jgi:hypothetical protein